MDLGKDHSQNFDDQVFAAMISFLRYAVLNYLNEAENTGSKGILFEHLADETAQITYVQRLWQFFRALFATSFSKIFELFEIEEEFQSYFYAIGQVVVDFIPALGVRNLSY